MIITHRYKAFSHYRFRLSSNYPLQIINYLNLPLDAFLEVFPHAGIKTFALEQLGMRSRFGKPALIDDTDCIGVDDRREAVSDHNDGFVFEQHVECFFDFVFVFGVGKGGRFVKYNNRCVLQKRAGNGKPLRFSA